MTATDDDPLHVESERQQLERMRVSYEALEGRALLLSAELNATQQELEALAASVSHDLRAPLRRTNAWLHLLAKAADTQLDAKVRGYLTRVWAETQQMEMLLDALLGLSKTARRELHRDRVDLSAIARSVVEGLSEGEPTREVAWTIADDLWAYAGATLMLVVLQNLFENAWKFTRRKRSARIAFGVEHNGLEFVYYVRDNGLGFDSAQARLVFRPFQRLQQTPETPVAGMGLATVKRIITRHGGRVWAQGKENRGATFYFTLLDETARQEQARHSQPSLRLVV